MLHKSTIKQETLDLLEALMSLDILKPYFLAGGTALALQLGHRVSYDLDLFGKLQVDYRDLTDTLKQFGSMKMIHSEDQAFQCEINDIKIDIVNYKHLSLLKPLVIIEGLRLASVEDIATMKIKAIEDRGYKRDFFDLYCLLNRLSLKSILELTEQKHTETNRLHVLRSLIDFTDAEDQEEPNMLEPIISWSDVKTRIKAEVQALA